MIWIVAIATMGLWVLLAAVALWVARSGFYGANTTGAPLPPAAFTASPHRRECAWCGTVMLPGVEPVSHGICPVCLSEQKRATSHAEP